MSQHTRREFLSMMGMGAGVTREQGENLGLGLVASANSYAK